jgi:hypothetical protein
MKTLKLLLSSMFVAGLVAGSAACGGNPVGEIEKLADEMCECKDVDCAKKVAEKMEKVGEKYKGKKEEDFSDDQKAKLMAATMKMMECQSKLQGAGDMGGAAGGGAPAGEPPAGEAAGGEAAGGEAAGGEAAGGEAGGEADSE